MVRGVADLVERLRESGLAEPGLPPETAAREAAGGENVFAETNKEYLQVSLEAVAGKQADAFLIFASSKEPGTKLAQFLFTTFPNMQASKDRRVIVTDYMFTTPGWRNAQTIEDVARQLHPDAFK